MRALPGHRTPSQRALRNARFQFRGRGTGLAAEDTAAIGCCGAYLFVWAAVWIAIIIVAVHFLVKWW